MASMLCTVCGEIGNTQRKMKGSILIELFLWFCFLVPGLIYSIWRHSTVASACGSCGSTAIIPVTSPIAQETLKDRGVTVSQAQALAKPQSLSFGKIAGLALLAILFIGAIGAMLSPDTGTSAHQPLAQAVPSKRTDSIGRPVPASVTNDAELLIYRCGKPDRDYSSENEDPRPVILSRLVEYKKAHLKYAYIPGGNGNEPPYKWKLMGLIDTQTNKAVNAGQLKTVLSSRLPCALGKP